MTTSSSFSGSIRNAFIFLLILLMLTFSSVFKVKETETVFLVEFGKIVRIISTPGLHLRMPIIQEIVFFDRRISQTDSPAREVISLDQKRLIIDAYIKYKITNPQVFFQSLKDDAGADSRIKSMLDSSMRQVIASYPMSAMLTEQRSEIMEKVRDILVRQTHGFGVKILDARIVRADLPVENSEAIFARMRTDRQKEARELRAQGTEEAQIITSKADRQSREIVAEAGMRAEVIKGKADKEAAKIYAKSFAKDPEFFKFYRTMEAYRKSLKGENTKVILSFENEFLKTIKK